MTPNELYKRPAIPGYEWIADAILWRCFERPWGFNYEAFDKQTRLQVKVHGGYDCHDGRRYAVLASIWMDGVPFAIVQTAGREGDDRVRVYETDAYASKKAAAFILDALCDAEDSDLYFDPDKDIPGLCKFYNLDFEQHWADTPKETQ